MGHDRKVHINDKKSLPEAGVDPMPLTFKVNVLSCFQGKHDRIEPMATCFQGKEDVHCTIGAMLY